jgi:hypothetical protein
VSQQTTDRDFLARLDAAIGCQQCGGPLTQSVSDYFCSEDCSEDYSEAHSDDLDDDWSTLGHDWEPDELADLEPVSWLPPRTWRLRRSTGDLAADQSALRDAQRTASSAAQREACAVRSEALRGRQRVIWAREWRLPRSSGNPGGDWNALVWAETTATTPAQYAACNLRRADLEARYPGIGGPSWSLERMMSSAMAGFAAGIRESQEEAQRARFAENFRPIPTWDFDLTSSPLVHSRISWPEVDAVATLGSEVRNNLPGIRPTTMRLSGVYRPTPVVSEGDTIVIAHNGETLRYVVEGVTAEGSINCRRHPEDGQPPTRAGAEITHAIVDETANFPSPQAHALEALRNRNTGPAPRPGRIRGNVPGARR